MACVAWLAAPEPSAQRHTGWPAAVTGLVPAELWYIAETLAAPRRPADDPDAFAEFDWRLHLALTRASENPVFTLILNGFSNLYPAMAVHYFAAPAARRASRQFYDALEQAARTRNLAKAEKVTREAMQDSLERWLDVEKKLRAAFANPGDDR